MLWRRTMSRREDVLVQALLDRLPPIDSQWPVSQRVLWLRAVAATFDLIYGENDGVITIEAMLDVGPPQ